MSTWTKQRQALEAALGHKVGQFIPTQTQIAFQNGAQPVVLEHNTPQEATAFAALLQDECYFWPESYQKGYPGISAVWILPSEVQSKTLQSLGKPTSQAPSSFNTELRSFLAKKRLAAITLKKEKKREPFRRMSFQASRQQQDVLVFCPVTGICGKLEMPFIPVALEYKHPLSLPDNALKVLNHLFPNVQETEEAKLGQASLTLDRQVLAGLVLTLLKGRHKIPAEGRETSAEEQNLVLQNAGSDTLEWLLFWIKRHWSNATVWTRIPVLSLDWKTHAKSDQGTVSEVLTSYAKFLRFALDPAALSTDELGKIHLSTKEKTKAQKSIKVYSAQKMQLRSLKDNKVEAAELADTLQPKMTIALRSAVKKTLAGFDVFSLEHKQALASAIRNECVGKDWEEAGKTLASTFENAKIDTLIEGMASLSDDLPSLGATLTIAERIAAKRLKEGKQGE